MALIFKLVSLRSARLVSRIAALFCKSACHHNPAIVAAIMAKTKPAIRASRSRFCKTKFSCS